MTPVWFIQFNEVEFDTFVRNPLTAMESALQVNPIRKLDNFIKKGNFLKEKYGEIPRLYLSYFWTNTEDLDAKIKSKAQKTASPSCQEKKCCWPRIS